MLKIQHYKLIGMEQPPREDYKYTLQMPTGARPIKTAFVPGENDPELYLWCWINPEAEMTDRVFYVFPDGGEYSGELSENEMMDRFVGVASNPMNTFVAFVFMCPDGCEEL